MDPCGTPHVILEGSEKQFSKSTLNSRLERYELNQPIVRFGKPIALNFFNSISWSIVSNAFFIRQPVSCQSSIPYQNTVKVYRTKM